MRRWRQAKRADGYVASLKTGVPKLSVNQAIRDGTAPPIFARPTRRGSEAISIGQSPSKRYSTLIFIHLSIESQGVRELLQGFAWPVVLRLLFGAAMR
jgi:hypothetical protein